MLSQATSTDAEPRRFRLCIDYVVGTVPNIVDLSGHIPFNFTVDVARPRGHARQYPSAHSQPVDVITNGSVLDVSDALLTGQLSLFETQDNYPEVNWKDCIRQDIPKKTLMGQTPDILDEAPKIVRIRPGPLANPEDPQRFQCALTPGILSTLKDQCIYSLKYPPALPEVQEWNGGITWWKLCSNPDLPPDLSAPTDQPGAKVRQTALPRFKCMRNPPHPPRIEYEIEIAPSVLPLSDTRTAKISIKTRLCEPTTYIVMMRKNAGSFAGLALATPTFDARNLDIFDFVTGVTISGTPRYATSQWTPGLSRAPMHREQLRELAPGQTYASECELGGETGQLEWFLTSFRIDDVNALLDRKLGIRLRLVHTFWAAKGIDELFGHAETFRRDYWYIPLTIESPAIAAFSVLQ